MKKILNVSHSPVRRARVLLLATVVFVGGAGFSLLPRLADATSVTDDFNRADGGLGANWTVVAGTAAPQISGNQMAPGSPGSVNSAYWSANSFGSDQFAQGNFTTPYVSGQYGPGIAVRLANSRGYFLWYGNADNYVSIWRMDGAGSWAQLASSQALTVANSDVWRIEAVGANISAYQNGNLVAEAIDGTYSSGSPGVWLYNAGNDIDNWSGGDVPPVFAVGGTVSGLNGTVVLQNNGGGDLTISNNGGFTFNRPLAGGSAYNVTVLTNPSGQTCTVSSGSGTVVSSDVQDVSVACNGSPPTVSGSDNFNRADGSLGAGWSDFSDGGLTVSGQTVLGTNGSGGQSGDMRTAESYPADQYSQIEITSTQLSGSDWVGPAVRVGNAGQDLYLGLYDYSNGAPYLQIFKRVGGTWTGISSQYSCGPLAAGTKLKLMVVGTSLALLENGVERASAYDSTLPGGAPGIAAYGTPTADNWTAGNAGFEVHYLSTDANGVESYDMLSPMNGYGPQVLRVLRPTAPAAGVPHRFIYAMPVEAGLGNGYGDGMDTLRTLNAQNQYNLTIVAPAFGLEPWYADNPINAQARQESFVTSELVPWVKQNLATSGTEQSWLIGFSKSGIGTMDLFLKHPDLFTLEAEWDFPFTSASAYDSFGGSSANSYGTDANFQANYRLTNTFLEAHKAPFRQDKRIWIGGFQAFYNDVVGLDAALTGLGMKHDYETPTLMAHRWDSGWVPLALAALNADSLALPSPTPTPSASATPTPSPAAAGTPHHPGGAGETAATVTPLPSATPSESTSPTPSPANGANRSITKASPAPDNSEQAHSLIGFTQIVWGAGISAGLITLALMVWLVRKARRRAAI